MKTPEQRINPIEIKNPERTVNEQETRRKYEELTLRLITCHTTITTMESCTSGQVASLITDTEGSSAVLKGAFVTYSNEAKILQGVPVQIIETYGVYSAETAGAMAAACKKAYQADIGIGITGSFGNPDPANADSLPGEVYFAIAADVSVLPAASKTIPAAADIRYYHCTVPSQPSRLAYKLYMADVIADVLLPILVHF